MHIGQFLLDELVGGQWAAKLLAVQGVLAGAVKAVFSGTQGTPSDAVAGAVQTGERAFQTLHLGEGVFFGHKHAVHDDFTGDGCTQTHFAVDGGGAQTLHAFFQHKATDGADRAGLAHLFGPDHKHVRDGRVGDPHFVALELVAALDLLRTAGHAGRVRAVVGLGQAKATNPFAGGEFGQVFLALAFGAELENGQHHQGRLHAHHRAVARVDTLDLTGDQAISDVAESWAAVFRGDGGAEQAELAHFTKDGGVGFFVAKGFGDAGQKLVLAVGAGRLFDHALIFRELLLQ